MTSIDAVMTIPLRTVVEPNGTLVPIELASVPFGVERIFFITGCPANSVRGRHAHRTCHQFLVCVAGECVVDCYDGVARKTSCLTATTPGLWVPPMIWAEQRYVGSDSSLLVLASQPFDQADYIVDFEEFKRMVE